MTPPVHPIRLLLATASLLGAAALATACGSAVPNSAAGPASPPSDSASPPASTAAPVSTPAAATAPPTSPAGGASAPCATSALKVTVLTVPGSSAAGTEHFPVDFTNVSRESCNLFGYPGVSLVTSQGGSQIGEAAGRQAVNSPTTVVLAPGATAYATMSIEDPGVYSPSACHQVTAHWLRVYPPNQTAAVTVPFTAAVCQSLPARLGKELYVAVVEPGNGKVRPEA